MPAPSSYEFTTALNTTAQTAVRDAVDAGTGAGALKLYTEADVLLATITLDDPCGTLDGNGQLTITAPATVSAVASGECTWGEVQDSDSNFVMRAPTEAGVAAVAGKIVLNTTTVASGADIELVSFTVG